LKDSLRSRDTVGRAANDETAATVTLVSDSEISIALDALERPQDAYKIARRLQQHLAQPIDVDGAQVLLPTSMGIAVHPEDGLHSDALVAAAVGAMQAAREEGKGLIRFARPAMNAVIFERLALETHLRHALERHELLVYYQPRVSIATGAVVSVEALLRWKHPELGMVSPAHFIPVAEESGLILPIGEWVLREACAQNRRWRDAGVPPIRMSVNLSPAQFREPDLMGIVRSALDDAGMVADSLELELTESLLLQKGEATVKTLHTLKDAGVHLSIDDFGTGYSSLNYIKRFPVDALKIDQSFIREMMTSEQDSTLTTSIILMGKGLNLTVVAEGVETRSQLGMLRALGCDQAQGYLFSRPVPAEDAARLIARGFASPTAT
jgi:EAL domain-containing protein (putative c-di-GMP-specific phosphodiesterase class I)